jgi:sarcosine oxidase, subunit gamma
MSDAGIQQSPLVQFWKRSKSQAGAGVELREQSFLGHLNLRGDRSSSAFLAAAQSILGVALPVKPNTTASRDGLSALWLGPDEWLIVTLGGEEERVAASLREGLAGHRYAVTNVTSGQTILSLSGPQALDTLEKGCGIDLDAGAFRPGDCAQTHLAKANVLIWRQDEALSYHLIIRRSFAEYAALWIEDAAQEFGFSAIR